MSLGKKLEELRGSIPIVEFAKLFEIHKNTYSNYVKRHSVPDMEFILKVCQKFSVSPNWLLLDVGPKHIVHHGPAEPAELPESEFVALPLMETWVIGNEGEILHDGIVEYVPIKRKWLKKSLQDVDEDRLRTLLLTRIRRDYMVPTVCPGDLILLDTDRVCRDHPSEGEIYLVRLPDGERTLHRVAVSITQEGLRIFIFPDNTVKYSISQFTLPSAAELHYFILGRVLWLFRQFQA